MKKFRNVPAFITLLAGFAACIMMILKKYTLVNFLWILAAVMVGFYIIGLLIRLILNIVFKSDKSDKSDKGDKDSGEDKESDEESEENKENAKKAGKA